MTAPSNDAELLARIGRDADMAAFEELYRRYEKRLYRFVSAKLNDPFAAADILHETMITVWQSAARFEGRSSVSTWMFGIAFRKTMDAFRKKGREDLPGEMPDQVDDGPGPDETTDEREMAALVAECIEGLSVNHRMAVELAFQEDMSLREVAEVTGVPEGTVKTRLHHAKKLLRHCLETKGARP